MRKKIENANTQFDRLSMSSMNAADAVDGGELE